MDYILPTKKGDELAIEIKQGMAFDPQKFKDELDNIKQAGFLFGKKADRAGFLALLCQTFGYSTEDIDPVLAGTADGFDKVVDDVLEKTAEKLAIEVPVSEVTFSTNVEADPPESVKYGNADGSTDEPLPDTIKMPVFLSDLDEDTFKKKRERFKTLTKEEDRKSKCSFGDDTADDEEPDGEVD